LFGIVIPDKCGHHFKDRLFLLFGQLVKLFEMFDQFGILNGWFVSLRPRRSSEYAQKLAVASDELKSALLKQGFIIPKL